MYLVSSQIPGVTQNIFTSFKLTLSEFMADSGTKWNVFANALKEPKCFTVLIVSKSVHR